MKASVTLPLLSSGSVLSRYLKFCLVGGSGVLVDMAVLFALASPFSLGLNLLLSKAIAAEVAIINNFVWNELWTFNSGPARISNRVHGFLAFNLVCLAGIGWSVLLLHIQVTVLHLNVWLANLIAIVLVSIWNFGLTLKWKSWMAGHRNHILSDTVYLPKG